MKQAKWYLELILGFILALMLGGNSVNADENLPTDAWKVEIVSPKEGFQYPVATFLNDVKSFHFYAKSKESFHFPEYIVVRWGRPTSQGFWGATKILTESGYFEDDLGMFEDGPWNIWADSYSSSHKKLAETEKILIHLVDPSHAPDLMVSSFEVVTLMPGEKALNGTLSDQKRYYFVWKVKNIGDKIARATKLKIECQALGGEDCPSSLNRSYDIKQLWPRPDNVSGAMKVWNEDPFNPFSRAKFRFKATIDPDNRFVEQKETNNTLMTAFDSGATIAQLKISDMISLAVDSPVVSPSAQVVYGFVGGTAVYTISGGDVPYTVSTNDPNYKPSSEMVTVNGGTFSVTIPDNSSAKTVTYTVKDSKNNVATALLSIALAQEAKLNAMVEKRLKIEKSELPSDKFKIPHTLTQAMRTDLMPTKLYIKVTNGECELWLKIKNLGQYWFRKKLEWEVYRNGSHAGTWGTDHKRDIGPGAEMEIRLAYPAALPISLFGMNNWRVKLIPEGGDQNENNNEIGPVSLSCKKLSSEQASLKQKETIQGLDEKDTTPVIKGSKRSYRIGEMVVFDVKGDTGKAPVVECFDDRRWSNKCPRDMRLQKMGAGAKTRYMLRTSMGGRYRLRVGKLLSDEIKVEKPLGKKVADAGKEPVEVSPQVKRAPQDKKQTRHVQTKLGDTKKKMPVKFDKPEFKNLDYGQTFPGGQPILFNLKLNSAYKNLKVKYELYKNSCKDKPFKVSTNNNFGKLPAGRYCVRAAYLGGKKANWSNGIPFVVKEKKNVKVIPKKKTAPRKKMTTQ